MRMTIWERAAVAVVGLALLSLTGRAQAGDGQFCCECLCPGATHVTCFTIATPSDCPAVCDGTNSSSCSVELFTGVCGQHPVECAGTGPARAPALGAGGLAAAALLLVTFGTWALRQSARRKRP